jgi:hypothetical protein
MASGKGRGCLKVGCVGCAVLAVVPVVVVIGLIVSSAVVSRREPHIEQVAREMTTPLPPGGGGPLRAPEVGEPGRIVLDLAQGSFAVRAAPPGSPIRIGGRYDAASYRLEEHRESYGETGWIYRVSFRPQGLLRRLVQHDSDENRLEIELPRDVPLVLEASIGTAESTIELGGLWLVSTDFDLGVGSHTIRFGEPAPFPTGPLRVASTIGALRVLELGNASPESVEIGHRLGETEVDLAGSWRRDAEVRVQCGIGECRVHAPAGLGLEIASAGIRIGESHVASPGGRPPADPDGPTVRLSVNGTVGELRID